MPLPEVLPVLQARRVLELCTTSRAARGPQDIRLAMVLRASGKKGGRPRAEWQLEEADADLLKLFRVLVPDKRPFVYTPASA